jgi:hypothetical protein
MLPLTRASGRLLCSSSLAQPPPASRLACSFYDGGATGALGDGESVLAGDTGTVPPSGEAPAPGDPDDFDDVEDVADGTPCGPLVAAGGFVVDVVVALALVGAAGAEEEGVAPSAAAGGTPGAGCAPGEEPSGAPVAGDDDVAGAGVAGGDATGVGSVSVAIASASSRSFK